MEVTEENVRKVKAQKRASPSTKRGAVGPKIYNVTTFAGIGYAGDEDGRSKIASFYHPTSLCIGPDGTMYIADGIANRIRILDPQGRSVGTLAGEQGHLHSHLDLEGEDKEHRPRGDILEALDQPEHDCLRDGDAMTARFNMPQGIAVNSQGHVFVADSRNSLIRRIVPRTILGLQGFHKVSIFAGNNKEGKFPRRSNQTHPLNAPMDVAIDKDDNVYVADTYTSQIRKFDKFGNESRRFGKILENITEEDYIRASLGLLPGQDGYVSRTPEYARDVEPGSENHTIGDMPRKLKLLNQAHNFTIMPNRTTGEKKKFLHEKYYEDMAERSTIHQKYTGFIEYEEEEGDNAYRAIEGFRPSIRFMGPVPGYYYGKGPAGVGYYKDSGGTNAEDVEMEVEKKDKGKNPLPPVLPPSTPETKPVHVQSRAPRKRIGEENLAFSRSSPFGEAPHEGEGEGVDKDAMEEDDVAAHPEILEQKLGGRKELGIAKEMGMEEEEDFDLQDALNDYEKSLADTGKEAGKDRKLTASELRALEARNTNEMQATVKNMHGEVNLTPEEEMEVKKETQRLVTNVRIHGLPEKLKNSQYILGEGEELPFDEEYERERNLRDPLARLPNFHRMNTERGFKAEVDRWLDKMSKVNPAPGYRDGHVDNAKFMFPRGIAFDNVGDLYIADCPADPTEHGHRIRKLSANGEVTTVTGGNIGNRDGRLSVALFNMPSSLTFDSENNLFVVETLGNRIRRITPKGEVTTIAGRAKTVEYIII